MNDWENIQKLRAAESRTAEPRPVVVSTSGTWWAHNWPAVAAIVIMITVSSLALIFL